LDFGGRTRASRSASASRRRGVGRPLPAGARVGATGTAGSGSNRVAPDLRPNTVDPRFSRPHLSARPWLS
jgi:hypothetical protein